MKQLRTIPWLTEGAIRFLDGYLRANMRVLEFGMGGSSIWMASRCNLISVENDVKWFDRCRERIPDSTQWEAHVLPRSYHGVCQRWAPDTFDLVLVDGRDRMLCFEAALPLIKPGGYIMLDNAEREHYTKVYVPLVATWNETVSEQRQFDTTGFTYGGWKTSWWEKPTENRR